MRIPHATGQSLHLPRGNKSLQASRESPGKLMGVVGVIGFLSDRGCQHLQGMHGKQRNPAPIAGKDLAHELLPTDNAVLLQHAGTNATTVYGEVHAPGILEANLSVDKFKGLLEEASSDVPSPGTVQEARQEQDNKAAAASSSSTETHIEGSPSAETAHPPLFSLISAADFEKAASQALPPPRPGFGESCGISSNASYPLGSITESGDPAQPCFFPLYVNADRRKTAELLSQMAGAGIKAIFTKLEVYVDGGFERGTDILKAIASGASAVGIGRPYLYSLVYGQEGAEHLTQSESKSRLRLCGITDLGQAGPDMLNTSDVDYLLRASTKFPDIPGPREPAKL
ncbi:uncharacterized protein PG986_007728 [Apiospora aurea]|uniref:FMN-dependent dehydrogenase domain-containing protein n=1 Tax=Apiospora aurea TaxID=335848 RepID=A0ABR1QDE4_9PEZI